MHEIKKKGFAHNPTPRSQRQSIVSGNFFLFFQSNMFHACYTAVPSTIKIDLRFAAC